MVLPKRKSSFPATPATPAATAYGPLGRDASDVRRASEWTEGAPPSSNGPRAGGERRHAATSAPPGADDRAGRTGNGHALLSRPGDRRPLARNSGRVVTVTGAASYLGTNLVGLLEEDERIARIVAIDIKPPQTAQRKTRFYEVDFTEPTAEARLSEIFAAERTDTLVHLAFLASPSHGIAVAHELESVGTRHVLFAARQADVRKVVMWSQTILYGAHPSNPNFLTEKHPLRAPATEPFFGDKIEAEAEAARFAQKKPDAIVTVLRTAPIVGPTIHNHVTRYLSRKMVPTMMGFDPLVQLLHEVDAIAAFKLAIDRDHRGVFNIVADGVLPLSTVIKLAGRLAVPVPPPLARTLGAVLWLAHMSEAPPSFLHQLRYLCVADGEKAKVELGFRPAFTTREAVLDFTSAQRLRDVKLLQESPV